MSRHPRSSHRCSSRRARGALALTRTTCVSVYRTYSHECSRYFWRSEISSPCFSSLLRASGGKKDSRRTHFDSLLHRTTTHEFSSKNMRNELFIRRKIMHFRIETRSLCFSGLSRSSVGKKASLAEDALKFVAALRCTGNVIEHVFTLPSHTVLWLQSNAFAWHYDYMYRYR